VSHTEISVRLGLHGSGLLPHQTPVMVADTHRPLRSFSFLLTQTHHVHVKTSKLLNTLPPSLCMRRLPNNHLCHLLSCESLNASDPTGVTSALELWHVSVCMCVLFLRSVACVAGGRRGGIRPGKLQYRFAIDAACKY